MIIATASYKADGYAPQLFLEPSNLWADRR